MRKKILELKEEIRMKKEDIENLKDRIGKKTKNTEQRQAKLDKKNKQLDFFMLMIEQGMEKQNEINNSLFQDQQDLEKQMQKDEADQNMLTQKKQELGARKKNNNSLRNEVDDMSLKVDQMVKERDRNNEKNRLKEVELELSKVNEDLNKTVKSINDNEMLKRSKSESLKEEYEKEKALKLKIEQLQETIVKNEKDSKSKLGQVENATVETQAEIFQLEKDLQAIIKENTIQLLESQKENFRQRQEHEDKIKNLQKDYETWRSQSQPQLTPLCEFSITRLNKIDVEFKAIQDLQSSQSPKLQNLKELAAQLIAGRTEYLAKQKEQNDEVESSRFLNRQLKTKVEERRLEINKVYHDLMVIDKVKTKQETDAEMATFTQEVKNRQKEVETKQLEIRDFGIAINKEAATSREEIAKLRKELGELKIKVTN